LEEAKELFSRNKLVILNNRNSDLPQSFLLSSRRNNGNRPTPSYLLISTKKNQRNRGFATAGPANEAEENSNNEAIAALIRTMSEQPNSLPNNRGATAGPAEANPSRNNELSSLNNPLLKIMHKGKRKVKQTNQPPAQTNNIEARLAALRND
jgi:hypothetical protein